MAIWCLTRDTIATLRAFFVKVFLYPRLRKDDSDKMEKVRPTVSHVGCGHDTLPSRPLARERAMSLLEVALRAPIEDGSRAVLTWQGSHFVSRQRGKNVCFSSRPTGNSQSSLKPEE